MCFQFMDLEFSQPICPLQRSRLQIWFRDGHRSILRWSGSDLSETSLRAPTSERQRVRNWRTKNLLVRMEVREQSRAERTTWQVAEARMVTVEEHSQRPRCQHNQFFGEAVIDNQRRATAYCAAATCIASSFTGRTKEAWSHFRPPRTLSRHFVARVLESPQSQTDFDAGTSLFRKSEQAEAFLQRRARVEFRAKDLLHVGRIHRRFGEAYSPRTCCFSSVNNTFERSSKPAGHTTTVNREANMSAKTKTAGKIDGLEARG